MTIKLSWRIVWRTLVAIILLALLGSGAYTNYHFFWRATGAFLTEDGTPLNRAQLIDFVIEEEIKRQDLSETE